MRTAGVPDWLYNGPTPSGGGRPVHFGLFVEEMRRGASPVSAFDDAFELADIAEAWGMDCVWLGEIHFTPARSVISASLQVASSIATRTRRLRVGTAVQVLPLNHPLRIAEEIATVDQISKGRFEFGIGRSGVVRSYDVYGVPYAESQARFHETLGILREAWKGEPFSHRGEFYRFENATVSPRPYQSPHPPIRMATTSDETFPAAGRLGLPIFVGLRATDMDDLQARSRRIARRGARPGTPACRASTCVFRSTPRRRSGRRGRAAREHRGLLRPAVRAGALLGRTRGRRPRRATKLQAERMANLSYEDVLARKVAFGTPPADQAPDRLREELGIDGIVVEPNPGGRIPPSWRREACRSSPTR